MVLEIFEVVVGGFRSFLVLVLTSEKKLETKRGRVPI